MKRYENVSRNSLSIKTPVIIRIDGKAFHTFTKGMDRPFDEILNTTMRLTALELCKKISGAKFAYTQSDEISILLTDTDSVETQAYFDYNVQKITSISASMATLYFNRIFKENVDKLIFASKECCDIDGSEQIDMIRFDNYINKFDSALFDSRCFNIPESEVVNYFIWRQKDCTRNSIQMVGRNYFSHKELHQVSCDELQGKLLLEKNINWNNYKDIYKRGTGIRRVQSEVVERKIWQVDEHIPIFSQDRSNYIQEMMMCQH
jgi:tRNA(His) 5'-end guanylyltransferase